MKTSFLETPSGSIRVVEVGSGKPAIAVHGLFNSAAAFEPLMQRLSANRQQLERMRLVAMDLPSSGESTPTSDFAPSWASFSRAVIEVADGLKLEQFDLIGHSMGAGISALVAAEHPQRIRRLVLVDAVALPFDVPLKGRLPLIPVLGELLFRCYGLKMFTNYFAKDVFFDASRLNMEKVNKDYRRFESCRSAALGALRATADPRPVGERLGDIDCPCLVIWGREDRLVPLTVGERLCNLVNQTELHVIDQCGHNPLEECPDASLSHIGPFLSA